MFHWLEKLTLRLLIARYRSAGLLWGDMESYSFVGEPASYDGVTRRLEELETRVMAHGFLPWSRRDLVLAGGYGEPLPALRRASAELERAEAEVSRLRGVVAGFYEAVAHGDDEHRAWLRERVEEYLEGQAAPSAEGSPD